MFRNNSKPDPKTGKPKETNVTYRMGRKTIKREKKSGKKPQSQPTTYRYMGWPRNMGAMCREPDSFRNRREIGITDRMGSPA
jgi:hypothetical protein